MNNNVEYFWDKRWFHAVVAILAIITSLSILIWVGFCTSDGGFLWFEVEYGVVVLGVLAFMLGYILIGIGFLVFIFVLFVFKKVFGK